MKVACIVRPVLMCPMNSKMKLDQKVDGEPNGGGLAQIHGWHNIRSKSIMKSIIKLFPSLEINNRHVLG